MEIFIPESEVRWKFTTSSGPGGQNVNKVATKVQLFWKFRGSGVLTDKQQERLGAKLASRINKKGELFVVVETTRSQEQNLRLAVDKMRKIVGEALVEKPKRELKVPKKVKRKMKSAGMEEGKKMREKKKLRGEVREWEG